MDHAAYLRLKLREPWSLSEHVFLPYENCPISTSSTANRTLFSEPTTLHVFGIAKRFCKFILSRKCEKDVLDVFAKYQIQTNDLDTLNIFDDFKRQQTGHIIRCYTFNIVETMPDSLSMTDPIPVDVLEKRISEVPHEVNVDNFTEYGGNYVVCGQKSFYLIVGILKWIIPSESIAEWMGNTILRLTELNWIDFETLSSIVQHEAFKQEKIIFGATCHSIPQNGAYFYSVDASLKEFMEFNKVSPHSLNITKHQPTHSLTIAIAKPWTHFRSVIEREDAYKSLVEFYSNKINERDQRLKEVLSSEYIIEELQDTIMRRLNEKYDDIAQIYICALFDYSPNTAITFCEYLCTTPYVFRLVDKARQTFRTSIVKTLFPNIYKLLSNTVFTLKKADGVGAGQYVCAANLKPYFRDNSSFYIRGYDEGLQPLNSNLWRFALKGNSADEPSYEIYFHNPVKEYYMHGHSVKDYDYSPGEERYVYCNNSSAKVEYSWILAYLGDGKVALGLKMKDITRWLSLTKPDRWDEHFVCLIESEQPAWIMTVST